MGFARDALMYPNNLIPVGVILVGFAVVFYFGYAFLKGKSKLDLMGEEVRYFYDGRRISNTEGRRFKSYLVSISLKSKPSSHFTEGIRNLTFDLRSNPDVFISRWKVLFKGNVARRQPSQRRGEDPSVTYQYRVRRASRLPNVNSIRMDHDIYMEKLIVNSVTISEETNFGRTMVFPINTDIHMLGRGGEDRAKQIFPGTMTYKTYPVVESLDSANQVTFLETAFFSFFLTCYVTLCALSLPKLLEEGKATGIDCILNVGMSIIIPLPITSVLYILYRIGCKKQSRDLFRLKYMGATSVGKEWMVGKRHKYTVFLFIGLMLLVCAYFLMRITTTAAGEPRIDLGKWCLVLAIALPITLVLFNYLLWKMEYWLCNTVGSPDEFIHAREQAKLTAKNKAAEEGKEGGDQSVDDLDSPSEPGQAGQAGPAEPRPPDMMMAPLPQAPIKQRISGLQTTNRGLWKRMMEGIGLRKPEGGAGAPGAAPGGEATIVGLTSGFRAAQAGVTVIDNDVPQAQEEAQLTGARYQPGTNADGSQGRVQLVTVDLNSPPGPSGPPSPTRVEGMGPEGLEDTPRRSAGRGRVPCSPKTPKEIIYAEIIHPSGRAQPNFDDEEDDEEDVPIVPFGRHRSSGRGRMPWPKQTQTQTEDDPPGNLSGEHRSSGRGRVPCPPRTPEQPARELNYVQVFPSAGRGRVPCPTRPPTNYAQIIPYSELRAQGRPIPMPTRAPTPAPRLDRNQVPVDEVHGDFAAYVAPGGYNPNQFE